MQDTVEKQAFMGRPSNADIERQIQQRLLSDNTLTFAQRNELERLARTLGSRDKERLLQVLSATVGAGIGAAAVRFLMRVGVIGTVTGGVLGALIGSRVGRPKQDPFIQRGSGYSVNNQLDMFGRLR